jgi:hypothetical protein
LCLLGSDPSRTVWWAVQRFAAGWLGRLLGDESNWARGDKRWVIVGGRATAVPVRPQTQRIDQKCKGKKDLQAADVSE